MRSTLVAIAGLMLLTGHTAHANVAITIDKNSQMMTVAVDGVTRYHWPVSTGIPSRETPNGNFRAFRMEAEHYSKEFDDAPMPNSIFFTKVGHAIHGTLSEGRLGTPASHGCVRLSRAHAATLYALVQQQGVLNTTVSLTGSASIALARNPRPTVVARRNPAQDAEQYDQQYAARGEPIDITPQAVPGRRVMPQQRTDDGYIYPADGNSTEQRYPAPTRGLFGRPLFPQPQQSQYYDNQGYAQQPAPQGYYTQQRQYYQPRSAYQE
ncbi:MAG: L,D-transpeptidase [Pseudolabrys sp.]|nr:L,D-transpeptidase [Pseudolabrys sp.]